MSDGKKQNVKLAILTVCVLYQTIMFPIICFVPNPGHHFVHSHGISLGTYLTLLLIDLASFAVGIALSIVLRQGIWVFTQLVVFAATVWGVLTFV